MSHGRGNAITHELDYDRSYDGMRLRTRIVLLTIKTPVRAFSCKPMWPAAATRGAILASLDNPYARSDSATWSQNYKTILSQSMKNINLFLYDNILLCDGHTPEQEMRGEIRLHNHSHIDQSYDWLIYKNNLRASKHF